MWPSLLAVSLRGEATSRKRYRGHRRSRRARPRPQPQSAPIVEQGHCRRRRWTGPAPTDGYRASRATASDSKPALAEEARRRGGSAAAPVIARHALSVLVHCEGALGVGPRLLGLWRAAV